MAALAFVIQDRRPMVTFRHGNLFDSETQTLVNAVNCVGVMGKGIAAAFKKRYPAMFKDYAARCKRGEVQLGKPYPFLDPSGIVIPNFPTKAHWRNASRLADIEDGLDPFAAHYMEWGIRSIAFPALGCGAGGLDWAEVKPLMMAKLGGLDLAVEIYEPG